MASTILIIIAIFVAILIVSFMWRILKTVFKVVLIAAIALAIIALFAGDFDLNKSDDNTTVVNESNSTADSVTGKITGFVAKLVDDTVFDADYQKMGIED